MAGIFEPVHLRFGYFGRLFEGIPPTRSCPLLGSQSNVNDASSDEEGGSPSLTARGFLRPEFATSLVVAIVGEGAGVATASVLASHTAISPGEQLCEEPQG